MKITGTFLDEISHDIPHQNWGRKEWDADFQHMKNVGIDTVILIRSGYRKFITYPSDYLIKQYGCYQPPVDLVEQFLELSDKHGMNFYFGLYDSGHYWDSGDMTTEIDSNRHVIDEVWQKYGNHESFKGWYLSMEISRRTKGAIEAFQKLGQQCKDVSGGLPTLISPWIDGKKAVMAASGQLTKADAVSLKEHESEWSEIFDGIKGVVDAVAFQDGHIDYHELQDFFEVNKKMADKFGLQCWTNAESFDRDMPIKFLPIKFEKLRLKLEAARKAGYDKAITFEFSHFMSPQSSYLQAGHLYNRYQEYLKELL
ncbi:DUF4434 domain-containing protein [Solitalea canadensis]|uniref:DUF4434 domain-containing protein n=1 Tax=Solitalea canadensis (strain ATCC 29591 / DSM 3403 / JCM 21819 / LMG 8368 / NBRC 15130 / NCIMB 12057 / USAM 9D) TaxID=929556 RepID=H8KRU4_SOLCM|nr:DUF4434 domain-containing protein [Solitalea canadensis]AFD07732.1 hypothetical protein Solca_2698 [Solitalea canadensis DSM 3403]